MVFHLASATEFWREYEYVYEVNVTGTEKLIEASKRAQVPKFIYVSTAAIVLRGKPVYDVDERLTVIRQHVQYLLLDLLEVAVYDDHAARGGVKPVVVELVSVDEFGCEEFVDEGDVVVDSADLEDLLSSG